MPSIPGFDGSVRGPFGPTTIAGRMADPRVADQPGLLVGDQVKPRAEIAFGKILLGGHVQPGQQLARLEHGDRQRGRQRLDHPREHRRVDPVAGDVGHQDAQPVVLQAVEVVDVAAQLVGRRVPDRQPQHAPRLGWAGHQGELDFPGQLQLERQLLVGRFQQPVPLGQLDAQVGDPQVGLDPREQLAEVVLALGLLDIVVGPGLEPGDLVLRSRRGSSASGRGSTAAPCRP